MSGKIKLGVESYSVAWLKSVTEEQAIKRLPHLAKDQVINAWKQANGLTKRVYASPKVEVINPKIEVVKPEKKRTKKS